jgi:endonuclease YncB( thermonuclease family)
MRRPASAICLGLLLLAAPAHGSGARGPARSSCEQGASEDAIVSVTARGELVAASGRTIALADIRLPAEGEALDRARAALQSLGGRRATVVAAGAPDRWNRISAEVVLLDEAASASVTGRLVDEGLALVDAGDRRALCRPELLVREERARAGRKGIWAGDEYRPVAAAETARLQGLVGRFALVEGVVRSVGERRERTYLNFGPDWASDLTVTIPKRAWTTMLERGVSAASLQGRRVRVRGIVEEWQGVAVEIGAPDMLEVLGQEVRRP